MIKLENLTKRFGGLVAVNNLSLDIPKGEIFGFLGPNGAGKTTTVKMLSGLVAPSSGSALVAGYDIVSQSLEAKKRLALVPDEPFVYPKLTGAEFLYFIGDLYGVPHSAQEKRIPEYLEMFDLSRWQGELLESYSHGMRQKLVIASVLLRDPEVVLLDEPLVGLDPKSARLVRDIILNLSRSGVTVFMCTHTLEIAEKLCHRLGILYEGSILALGTVDDLRKRSGQPLFDASGARVTLEDIFLTLTGGAEAASFL
ncbi:MAG: ABC transporter ATP-binding protein [Elusimicrobia bacterium]|nr:ABC transporter ATP-binding protein [Elusimicrobiota bacterium]